MMTFFEVNELALSGASIIARFAAQARTQRMRDRYIRISQSIEELAHRSVRTSVEERIASLETEPMFIAIRKAARTELEAAVRELLDSKTPEKQKAARVRALRIPKVIDIDAAIARAYLAQREREAER